MRRVLLLGLVGLLVASASAGQACSGPADDVRTAGVGESSEDDWIATSIRASFFIDPYVSGHRIKVAARDGVVTLEGHVESREARRRAIAIARQTEGVRRVVSRLKIQPEDGPDAAGGLGDTLITTRIQSLYFLDPDVHSPDVKIETVNGTVTLRGEVSSTRVRSRALTIAKTTTGVRRVVDRMTVRRT